jgi:hypothetical protein
MEINIDMISLNCLVPLHYKGDTDLNLFNYEALFLNRIVHYHNQPVYCTYHMFF